MLGYTCRCCCFSSDKPHAPSEAWVYRIWTEMEND